MSELVSDEYNTVFGPVQAVRLTEKNIEAVAEWCGGSVIRHTPLDAPAAAVFMKMRVLDRQLRVIDVSVGPGEWVVYEGDFTVYADELFLKVIKQKPMDDVRHEKLTSLLSQLMEYQDSVTQRGGTTEETVSAAEMLALQILYMFR